MTCHHLRSGEANVMPIAAHVTCPFRSRHTAIGNLCSLRTPLVIGEANAFGLPALATDVGGMATLVKDGRNGRLFSREATAAEYCDYIGSMMRDYDRYEPLALSSLREYESRLNWTAAARMVKDVLDDVMK